MAHRIVCLIKEMFSQHQERERFEFQIFAPYLLLDGGAIYCMALVYLCTYSTNVALYLPC